MEELEGAKCKCLTSFVYSCSVDVIMHVKHVSIYSFRCWLKIKNGDRNETRLAEENMKSPLVTFFAAQTNKQIKRDRERESDV